MIKKMILMLLVLVGGVVSANAWGTIYLNCQDNDWGGGSSIVIPWVSENTYYYTLPGSKINSSDFSFRIYASWDNDGGEHLCPENDGDEISESEYSKVQRVQESGINNRAFKIKQNANAKCVCIKVRWGDNKWNISINTFEDGAIISYVNSNNWDHVYAYAWDGYVKPLGEWPGTEITGNTYGLTIGKGNNTQIIFSAKSDGTTSDGTKTEDLQLTNNAVYNADGVVPDQTISITNDYGTFASPYPLTFPADGAVYAYKATTVSGGKVIMERVSGTVPAKTGLFLAKNTAKTMTVSPCATTTVNVSGNYLHAGGVSVTSDDNTYRYGFQTQSAGAGFYKITGTAIAVPAAKAYLEIPASEVGNAPSLSIDLDGETTGIKVINFDEDQTSGNGQAYDLQGRRVENMTKGVYIVKGKKVIVK